ncbi:Lox9p [Orobanche minor]
MLKEWHRVYDYAYYNDLGSPDKGEEYARPVLGGQDYLYPRRARTGRPPNKKGPEIKALFDKTIDEFDTFQDVLNLYEGGVAQPDGHSLNKLRKCIPWELVRGLLHSDGERCLKFPVPDVIKRDRTAWRTDEEFGTKMLAGVNPVIIRSIQEFPPKSTLDHQQYGDHDSTITREQVERNMNGLTVDEAIEKNTMFILDHHDALMPYLRRINSTTTKTYASRTILLLQDDGTLNPLAIELILPHEDEDVLGAVSDAFTPCDDRVGKAIWQLAKAYVAVNDSGHHQLISHWLNTHAMIEPFVIATNRQLSVPHPIHKLLNPHFRDTIQINAFGKAYPHQCRRGVVVRDQSQPHGLKLLIEDYPFAVDGLDIWSAIEAWVFDYCSIYYPTNDEVQRDTELQSWWKELCKVGHGDLKDKPWWPKMQTRAKLIQSCTIIIWVASALHAAVNFGQYPYAGYLRNRPTVSLKFMPKPQTPEFVELESNPDLAFLKTITAQLQTLLGVSVIEILCRHMKDEIYLGRGDNPDWTIDEKALEAFKRFSAKLIDIEKRITDRNNDRMLKNSYGPVEVPYTLLYPSTSDYSREVVGLTGKGIPNSISI